MAAGWRQMYNQWEKAVSPSLEGLMASDGLRDTMAVGAQMTRAVKNQTEQASRRWLHLWNLPAAGDVRGLRRQIASLDREVQTLRRQLDAAEDRGPMVDRSPELTLTLVDGDAPIGEDGDALTGEDGDDETVAEAK
ncbi:MAG: hypothetical protein GY929_14995 [Actinomycetia bacterium]|nr:hypothetical protein [Actinomycetes bacterium]